MKKYVINLALLAIGMAFNSACSKKLAPPTSQELDRVSQSQPGANTDLITMGFEAYVVKCSSCHVLYKPSEYTQNAWENDILPMMAPKANLQENEFAQIKAYVTAFSKDKSQTAL